MYEAASRFSIFLSLVTIFTASPLLADREWEIRSRAQAALIIVSGTKGAETYENDDLRVGRELDRLPYTPTKLSTRDYFEQTITPKLEALEDALGSLDGLREILREFRSSPLSDVSWDIYFKSQWREFEKTLPKGAAYATHVLMAYDERDGGVFPISESLEVKMKRAGLNLDLVAADLHVALYRWVKTQGRHDHAKLYEILPRLVAHLMSDEDGDMVSDWYQTPNKLEAPRKTAIEINGYEFIDTFAQDNPVDVAKAERLMESKCEEWKNKVRSKIASRSVEFSEPECWPRKIKGVRWVGRWEWGYILNIVGKVKVIPKGYYKHVKRVVYSAYMKADSDPNPQNVPIYENAKAEYELCEDEINRDLKNLGAFAYFGFCPAEDSHGTTYDTANVFTANGSGDPVYRNGQPQEGPKFTIGYLSSTEVDLIVAAKHRIESRSVAYSVSGKFGRNFTGFPMINYFDLNQAYRDLDGEFADLDTTERRNKAGTYLLGIPFERVSRPARKLTLNIGLNPANFSVGGTAEFLWVRR